MHFVLIGESNYGVVYLCYVVEQLGRRCRRIRRRRQVCRRMTEVLSKTLGGRVQRGRKEDKDWMRNGVQ